MSDLARKRLRAWVRTLRATRAVEAELARRLRSRHGVTLPRFDVMAALWRTPDGVTMTELSRFLLVSNGNSTALVDGLERDGLVARSPAAEDRRSVVVRLTDEGRALFGTLATEHEAWVDELLSDLDEGALEALGASVARMGSPA